MKAWVEIISKNFLAAREAMALSLYKDKWQLAEDALKDLALVEARVKH